MSNGAVAKRIYHINIYGPNVISTTYAVLCDQAVAEAIVSMLSVNGYQAKYEAYDMVALDSIDDAVRNQQIKDTLAFVEQGKAINEGSDTN